MKLQEYSDDLCRIKSVIAPGREPFLLLIPSQEAKLPQHLGVTEFMRAACAATGQGFATFIPERDVFDVPAHTLRVRLLWRACAEEAGVVSNLGLIVGVTRRDEVVYRQFASGKDCPILMVQVRGNVYSNMHAMHAFATEQRYYHEAMRASHFEGLHL